MRESSGKLIVRWMKSDRKRMINSIPMGSEWDYGETMEMKKRFIVSVVVMSLLLAGCADRNTGTSKPKAYVPYSALIKDESTSSKPEPIVDPESNDDNSVNLENSDNVPVEIDDDNNSIDYDALTEAIADKVADKIAEKLEKEKNESQESDPGISSSQSQNNSHQPSNEQGQYGGDGYTTTAKYPSDNQGSTSVSQKQDNSQVIFELNQAIRTYESEISLYQAGISELNEAISELGDIQADCEDKLKKAKVELANAQKRTVWVFEGNDFKQVPDEGAVSKAQERVDTYESLIAECKTTKEEAQKQIEKYEIEIAARESAIAICQLQINELS